MSFATFKNKSASSKVVLLEFGVSTAHSFFLNEEPGIWRFQWRVSEDVTYGFEVGAFCYGSFENGGTEILTNGNAPINIVSVIVDGTAYTEVASLVNLRATNESYWWDDDGVLHVHFDGFAPPWVFSSIKLGLAVNEANKAGVYNGLPYGSRLTGLSPLSIEADPLFYGVLGYSGLTAELANADGEFDGLSALDIFGQVVNVLYGEEGADYADFELLYSGLVREFSLDALTFRLEVTDKRRWFAKSIPPAVFDLITYPDLDPQDAGKPIPLAWGSCDNVPVVCTNELEVTPASYSFKLCDTTFHAIKAIDAVRVNGVAVTPASTTLATATFTLATTDYEPGQTVTADIRGYESGGALIENALDVVADLLEDFGSLAYIVDVYDTVEWAAAAALAPDIQLFIGESQAIEAAIEKVCVSLDGVMFVKGDGRFTFRYQHAAESIVETIGREEMFEEPELRYASDNFLSALRLGYDRDHDEGALLTHVDDSLDATFQALYGMTYRYEAETLLNILADVEDLAASLLATYARVATWTRIQTSIEHIQLELMDDVTVNLDRAAKPRFGEVDMRVYGIRKDVMAGTVELTLRGLA